MSRAGEIAPQKCADDAEALLWAGFDVYFAILHGRQRDDASAVENSHALADGDCATGVDYFAARNASEPRRF